MPHRDVKRELVYIHLDDLGDALGIDGHVLRATEDPHTGELLLLVDGGKHGKLLASGGCPEIRRWPGYDREVTAEGKEFWVGDDGREHFTFPPHAS